MESIDQIFDKLVKLEDDEHQEILLRNKASFTSQISDQFFVESFLRSNVKRNFRTTFIMQIVLQFKKWISSIFTTNHRNKYPQGNEFINHDFLEHDYSEIFGEEFDMDNIPI